MPILYKDTHLTFDSDGITIGAYYFPFGSKRVLYNDIKKITERPLSGSLLSGRYRIWGSGDLRHWYHFDMDRPVKNTAFVLDVGSWAYPVITPDDVAAAREVLIEQGITPSK